MGKTPLNPIGTKGALSPFRVVNDIKKLGGGGDAPAALPDPPAPSPPITASGPEIVEAGQSLRRQELMKKSVKKTTFAGETGGFGGPMIGGKQASSPYGNSPTGVMGAGASLKV